MTSMHYYKEQLTKNGNGKPVQKNEEEEKKLKSKINDIIKCVKCVRENGHDIEWYRKF